MCFHRPLMLPSQPQNLPKQDYRMLSVKKHKSERRFGINVILKQVVAYYTRAMRVFLP